MSLLFIFAWGGGGFDVQKDVFAQTIPAFTPQTFSLSASLLKTDNTAVADGEYAVRFSVYPVDRASAADPEGVALWQETQKITVKSGILQARLGSTVAFPQTLNFNGGEYYLGIKVGDDAEMTPRKRLGSVPSAVNSQFLRGLAPGTVAGSIPVLGANGKIDIKQLPTGRGTSSSQLVLVRILA